jgi:hypothetical protein
MNGQFTQIGSHNLNVDEISDIDTSYQPSATEGGGTRCVRVFLTSQGMQPRQYFDWRGNDAVTIRRNLARTMPGTGNLPAILLPSEEAGETQTAGTTNATSQQQRRGPKAKAKAA